MRALLKLLFRILLRVRIRGDLSSLCAGRALVVANHDSLIDAAVLGLFLPRRAWIIVTAQDMEYAPTRMLARFFRHRVVDLSKPASVIGLVRMLEAGELLAVFPQGRVSTTGSGMKVYHWVASIAARSGAPIVPVTIDGLLHSRYGLMRGTFPRQTLPRVTIRVFAAVELPAPGNLPKALRRTRASDALTAIMQRAAVDSRPRQTLFEALLGAIDLFGRDYRIVEDVLGKHETYGDLLKRTLATARMASRITGEGEVVGVMLPNLARTACLVLGLGAIGRVPALLNYTAGDEAISSACVAAGIRTVITSRAFVETARLYKTLDALCNQRIIFTEDLLVQFGRLDKVLVALALLRPRSILRSKDPGAPAVVLFTSGSEAKPKGVVLSHDAILSNIAQMRAVIDFCPADRFLNALPMFHSYGLTACTLMPLFHGVGLYIYTNPLRYRVIPEIAYLRDCTFLFGTSTFLGRYAREAHPYDFYRVRCVVSGAEKLNPEVAELWLEKFGLRIIEGYGTTECAPVLSLNTPLAYRLGSVGRFLPAVEHRLVPVEGITNGGRLHVRGPNLMLGYYLYDDAGVIKPPQSEIGAGWYDTGDVVGVDDDGFAMVLGRVKRFAKIAGEMVALEMVERVAQHASPRHQHAATVEMLPGSGESTVLCTTDPTLARGLLQRSAKLLGSQELAVARRIVYVEELPMLGSGKTDYVTLKSLAVRAKPRLVIT
jgi:acyl-[acyl-carrier-protein]-phospholipid O-acyltransferase/long-chain-fatty-acid--[acyl-carrier-protein] ligase